MSFKVEVIADSSGQWASNGLRFETEEAARAYWGRSRLSVDSGPGLACGSE